MLDRLSFLIADDSDHMRTLIRTVLHSVGCRQMFDAIDGSEALAILQQHPVDIAIIDWNMEPMDGLTLTRHLRTASDSPAPYLPIIMVTGYSQTHHVMAARDAGVTEFLSKPLSARALVSRVLAIVEKPRPFVRADHFFGPDRRRRALPEVPRERRHLQPEAKPAPRSFGLRNIGFDLVGSPLAR